MKQAVKRNIDRFPPDFMFELSAKEAKELDGIDLFPRRGGSRYLPYAFTEQGVAMLSSVLRSERAIEVNIAIMRAFVALRQHLSDYQTLKEEIARLEEDMNLKFSDISQALNYLFSPAAEREPIGFRQNTVPS